MHFRSFPEEHIPSPAFHALKNTSTQSDADTQSVRRPQNPSAVRAPANVHHPAKEEDFNPNFPNSTPKLPEQQ